MKATNNQIVNLADDIRQIVVTTCGEGLQMVRLCKDHPAPVFLDEQPILDITQDEFVGIFDFDFNHYFLSPDQVLRIGEYCRLPVPNILALILKAEWESFLSEMAGYSCGAGAEMRLSSILNDKSLIKKYSPDFQPDKGKISNLVGKIHDASNDNAPNGHIDFYIEDLMKDNTFLIENGRISQLYPQKDITEKILLHKVSESERNRYFRAKELWMVKSTELDDMLLSLEQRKRLNMGIENKYFKMFGEMEIEKSKFEHRVEKYKIILREMQDHPELSYRELLKLATNELIEAHRKRNDLKNKFARSLNCVVDFISGCSHSPVTTEFKNSYMQACKKLLRKLFFLLHSDTCPQYSRLSQKKRAEVNNLWLELMKSTKDELHSFSPSLLLYSLPDYDQLELIYKRACEILGITPDDFKMGNRLEFMIRKGTQIRDLMEFLRSETGALELHLAHLELIQDEYIHEDKTNTYRNALADINAHSKILKDEISNLKEQIPKLKRKISNRLTKSPDQNENQKKSIAAKRKK